MNYYTKREESLLYKNISWFKSIKNLFRNSVSKDSFQIQFKNQCLAEIRSVILISVVISVNSRFKNECL